ncbi:endosome-associated-trafficking regulator 1 isoform X2 [Seriola aureovittata]|uniref:endosome-associated-trafficking regulator 1 isoform X2 n=1 Tax=Seriola aureovittata TaxID=2871759 RepID=UPI0024BED2E0|nr:endosome-associated-trafficking regulator 1 isoform X2 [Seriola aureovittata]
MSRRRSSKTLIIADDEEVEDQELNPFSFREFLRWKNQDPHQEPEQEHQEEQTQGQSSSSQRVFDVRNLTLDPDAQTCFFSEPSLAPQEEEEAEGWGRGFQSGVDSTSSLCTEEDEDEDEEEETRFSSKPEVQQGGGGRGGGGGGGGENYEGDDETSMAEPATSCRRKSGRSSQLKEENMLLRRTIRELQRRSDAKERRVLELSEELLHRRRQEEKEAQDLESMVHSVEQNLHLMTKRAVKAENSVSKLKLELQQLQVEVDSLQSENDSLKAAESQVVMTMRQNAHVASEYLKKTASHAHSSIRQLLGEAETLSLVSHLLQSIDKISNVDSQT